MSQLFKFKQFAIEQSGSAMKIGTDGVLLGAWTDLSSKPQSVLDIGSGTGIIALMVAQRSLAELIDAIEIDEEAYEQTVENFENSPWSDRLFCYHAEFLEFVEEMQDEKYDLILSNPPFFDLPLKKIPVSEARQKARFQNSLSYEDLCEGAAVLLSDNGIFSVIIPYSDQEKFLQIAKVFQLHPKRITQVRGKAETELKRSLIEFSFEEITPQIDELIIEIERHQYTPEYTELVKDFYLKM